MSRWSSVPIALSGKAFARGRDCAADGRFDIADPIMVISYTFGGGRNPDCFKACDGNDDGKVDLADPIYLLVYLFRGGASPYPPFPACASDPTADALTCEAPAACP
jgi:hypothetical protein